MYLTILKKDITRKKTMNIILLIFVTLAATFIASSANNLYTVSNALDHFFAKADIPDYWFAVSNTPDIEAFEEFAKENNYRYHISRLIQIEPKNIFIDDEKFEYYNTVTLSSLDSGIKIFAKDNEELTDIEDGGIYVPYVIFQSQENNFNEGGKISIKQDGIEKEFTIKGYTKDALFGSTMIGMTRFLISENDAALFDHEQAAVCSSVEVYTKDAGYPDKFHSLGTNSLMAADRSMIGMMYFMDMLMAAILLVVSVCLILISMVILRFIIHFTITEEYREIGVMKAIGIKNSGIRGLYIMKYLMIAVIGTTTGLLLSIPFGKLMLRDVSEKIILASEDHILLNVGAAVFAGAVVVLFSYYCTRKIRRFSPIDAIHSGETGERFRKKGFLRLGRSCLPPVPFMALNDIFSGIKSYVSMILIFILGTLLVILPVNTINTLRSDDLVTMFNMAKSDHVISTELLFNPNEDNLEKVNDQLTKVRELLARHHIEADVFQEIIFRSNVSKGNKRTNSISFHGRGGVTTDQYAYIEGTPPQNTHEVALSYITADQIGAHVGDDVKIKIGGKTKTYTVTAINQGMNNMGECVRFHPDVELDYHYAVGNFGIQITYKDSPDDETLAARKKILEQQYPDANIYSAGEYVSYMIGNVAEQLDSMKTLILTIILGINILVAVLMVKSFITKEKREIALLKAIGFKNNTLILIQTLRIGFVLLLSVITGVLVSSPLSSLIITPIFHMMGAHSIEYEIHAVEVYAVFPLIMLAATACAAFLSAQGLRNISSSEISGIE